MSDDPRYPVTLSFGEAVLDYRVDAIEQRLLLLETGVALGGVPTVFDRSGAVAASSGDYNADQITETTTNKIMTATERVKLAGIQAGAQVNPVDLGAFLDSGNRLAMTPDERTKLAGIASNAQANPPTVSDAVIIAGTSTAVISPSPAQMKLAAITFGGGGGGGAVASVFGRIGAVVAVSGDYNADLITETATRKFLTTAERAKLAGVDQVYSAYEKTKLAGIAINADVNTITSVLGRIGAVVAASGDYNADQITETATNKILTSTERTKLAGIQTGAQVNTIASVFGRTGDVVATFGDYNTDQVIETAVNKFMTATERTKLAGIQTGAQVQPAPAADAVITTGTSIAIFSYTPAQLKLAAITFGGGSGGGAVASVFGRTGVVLAAPNDYNADQITETSTNKILTSTERTKLAGIAPGATVSTITSVLGRIGVVLAQSGDYNADQITETATNKILTSTERTKLAGIQAGAQVNTVISVLGRTGAVLAAPGDYTADQITETTKKFISAADQTKLAGIQAGAQVQPTAATNLDITTGTGNIILGYTPAQLKLAAVTFGGASGAVSSVFGRTGAVLAAPNDYNADQILETASNKILTSTERTKLAGIQAGAQVNTVTSVLGRTGAVLAASGDYNADQILETASNKVLTAAERTKLAGIAAGATVSPLTSVFGRTGVVVATLGDYNTDLIPEGANKYLLAAERTKLAGIQAGAQVQPTAATNLDITNGVGTTILGYTPAQLKLSAQTFGGGGGAITSVFGRTGVVLAAPNDYNADQILETASNKVLTAAERTKLAGIAAGATVSTVTSVLGRTGAVLAASGDYNADQILETASNKVLTAAERTKLAGIAAGAQVNIITSIFGRTGVILAAPNDYNADQITETATNKVLTSAERIKLAGIAAGADVNAQAALDAEVTTGTLTSARTFTPAQLKLAAVTWGPAATPITDPYLKIMTANGLMPGAAVICNGSVTSVELPDPNVNRISYIFNNTAGAITVSPPGGGSGGAIPTYVGHGNADSSSVANATLTPSYPTTVAGDILYLHVAHANNSGSVADTFTPSGGPWTLLYTDQSANQRQFIFRKVSPGTTAGTTINVVRAGTGAVGAAAIIHAFRGALAVPEEAKTAVLGTPAATSILDSDVTTLGPNRLVVNFGVVNTDQNTDIAAFVGGSGGTWVLQSVTAGVTPMLFLQTAAKAVAGLIGGGSDAITTAAVYTVTGFALQPAAGISIVGSASIAAGTAAKFMSYDPGAGSVTQIQRVP